MKILHVTDRFSTGGGLEHIYRICSGIGAHEFHVLAEPGPGESRFSTLTKTRTVTGGCTPNKVREIMPDLIHFHHLRPLARWIMSMGRPAEIPILLTVHGLHVRKYDFQTSFLSPAIGMIRRIIEKRLFVRCSGLIAVSRDDRKFLQGRYGISEVHYIPNGIPLHPQSYDKYLPEQWRERYEIPEKSIVALVPARFDFQKGHDILIKALAGMEMDSCDEEIVFLLAGGGRLLNRTRALAGKLGVDSALRFLGDCAHEKVMALMSQSDLVVLPSRWEGLPIALLEAGMLARPVIASDACGNREVIFAGGGRLFRNQDPVDLAGALRESLRDPEKRRSWGVGLKEKVMTEYSLEGMLDSLHQVYGAFQSLPTEF